MKTNVNVYNFRDSFLGSDTYKNNFSYDGLTALYDYLTQLEEDTGEEFELDICFFCCDYAEYTIKEYNRDFNKECLTIDDVSQEDSFICEIDSDSFIINQNI